MLETPLYGRFGKEKRRLVFGPTKIYDTFVNATAIGGGVLFLCSFRGGLEEFWMGLDSTWCFCIGGLVLGAAAWAYLSLVRISFDLKNGTYWRRQGPGFLPKMMTGKVADLDAMVLIAEPNAALTAGGVTYHLVLHWKPHLRIPLMVVQNDTRSMRPGEPLQLGGAPLMQLGVQYAQALGIPFYDNSHFPSKCPVAMF